MQRYDFFLIYVKCFHFASIIFDHYRPRDACFQSCSRRMVSLCGGGLYTIILGRQEPSLYLARNCENNIVTLRCFVIVPFCLNPSNSSWWSILIQTVLYDSNFIVVYDLEISCIHLKCQYEEPHILFRCGIAACLIYINHVFTLY